MQDAPYRRASIVTPTLHRPGPLARALASVTAQEGIAPEDYEIVVVDNSADGDARAAVERIARESAVAVRYLSEPRPGVATARNAGVAAARGTYIAFLDDDEEAAPRWLASLVETAERTGADAVFGPVRARPEPGAEMGPFAPYFSRELEAVTGADITRLHAYLGTNNSLFSRGRCLAGEGPFAERLDRSGGEDSLLLKSLVLTGRRLAWCAEAEVTEWVPHKRLSWDYVHRRKFLSGQVRSFVYSMLEPPRPAAIAGWMAVGAVQWAAFSALSLALSPLDATRAARLRATARGGLGKVLWMERFRPGLYGTGLVS